MIGRLKNLERNFSVPKAAAIVALLTVVTKLGALVRDSLLASHVGPGLELDAYYAAFRVPDFVFNLLVLGTLPAAFIPVFSELSEENQERAARLARQVLGSIGGTVLIVCAVLFVFAEPLTRAIVPGFSGEQLRLTVQLNRLFLLSPIIFTCSSLLTAVLHSRKRFLTVSVAPLLYNVGIIGGIIFGYPRAGMVGVGWGVIIGALMHAAIQLPEVISLGVRPWPALGALTGDLRRVIRLFLPRILSFDLSSVSLIVATWVGSRLPSGTVSSYSFASNLESVPLGLLAYPLALAAFPALAEAHARRDRAGFTHLLTRTLQQVLFFAVPTAAFTIIFRAQAVRLLLGYGRFTWDDTVTTLGALGVLALAVVPQAVAPLLSRAFFSLHNTVSPVVANLASISVNLVVALALGHRAGIGGIAWAFVIASWLNVVLLWLMLRPKLGEGARAIERSAWRTLVATTGAAAIGCAAAYGVLYASAPLVGTDTVLGLAIQTGSAALAGVIAFFATAAQLGTQEARAALDLIKKIWYRTTAFRT